MTTSKYFGDDEVWHREIARERLVRHAGLGSSEMFEAVRSNAAARAIYDIAIEALTEAQRDLEYWQDKAGYTGPPDEHWMEKPGRARLTKPAPAFPPVAGKGE